ncbi:hypothetical protein PR202_gb06570 [Eleusine coracana subsp. coracana]|uniref:Uncharacterized protein n=1 Tax=Eleusine coracana subsp. coracana TaxID=191504 RepID=A0AAV5E941_ELECO|nr:hypothetical protein PR202_gb06570 [Eleusine coracana subsp. coracana]
MRLCPSFFACASDGSRRVFVAGSHDEENNALRSAAMARERDEARGGIGRAGAAIAGSPVVDQQSSSVHGGSVSGEKNNPEPDPAPEQGRFAGGSGKAFDPAA